MPVSGPLTHFQTPSDSASLAPIQLSLEIFCIIKSFSPLELIVTASVVVGLVTVVNLMGLRSGKITQNLLTVAKLGGIALLILAGVFGAGEPDTTVESDASGDWTKALKPVDGAVFRVERILDVNKEFAILHRFYIDPTRFPRFAKLAAKDFRSSNLRVLLARMYHLPVITHHQTLLFHRFPATICRLLQCRAGTTGLLQSVTATIGDNDVAYFAELYIPPNGRALQLPDMTFSR